MESNIVKIVKEYLSNRFFSKTEENLQRWIIEEQYIEEKEKASEVYWDSIEPVVDKHTYKALERVNARIGVTPVKRQIPLRTTFFRIAAILIPFLFILGGYLYYDYNQNWIRLSVAYGEEKYLLLPDSSEVWLNAGTSIRYPSEKAKNKRIIYLSGEAYFSVKRDTRNSFIVKTDQGQVKVLGTAFNVKAYPNDEKMITTLTSGKVEVNINNKESVILEPSQQLAYNTKMDQFNITEIPLAETKAWLDGHLIFTNATWKEIQQTLEREFDVSFNTDPSLIARKELYTVKFLKQEKISDILNVLSEVVGDISFQTQGKTIIIKKR